MRLQGRALENKIDWLIRIHLFSFDSDAGWHGTGTLGALGDFKGELPHGGGCFDHDSKMINEVGHLDSRRLGPSKKDAAFILNKLTSVQRQAVEYDIRFRNEPSENKNARWMTNEEIAERAEMTLDQYESAKKRGRSKFKKEYLQIIEILENNNQA